MKGHRLVPSKRLRPLDSARRTAGVVAAILALGSLPAGAQDGGVLPPAVLAERAQLLQPGGNWVEAECFSLGDGGTDCGGAWLPSPRLVAVGRELTELREENAALREAPPVTPAGIAVAFVVGVVLGGVAVGVAAWRLSR